ncbi:MAG: tol-pal system protein YbgF [Desulfobacter sp.]|nr:tol-pal system protein YbgF [Desulfobacter sp.]WDP86267.1 MAG: tol-pal system protein YbgF [Desulfobacter sp.]
MFQAKPVLIKLFFLISAVVLVSSCSALDYFKTEHGEPDPAGIGTEKPLPQSDSNNKPAPEQNQIQDLEKKIVVLEDKVTTLETQVAGQKKVVYTIEYSDPAKLYEKARTLLLANETDNAADLFATFADKHPGHALADNALYWLGECYYTTGEYQKSIEIFKTLVKQYPKAGKVPDALLKTGYAYVSLDDANRASHYFKQVIKKHPFSLAAKKAQVKLKEFQ